jgi:hypothetical protein
LLLSGALTLAAVVDLLTRAQLRRQLGALPVLCRVLEILQVRQIINRHCPTAAEIDYGAVAVVLIINRLMAPRPLYKVADWIGKTVLVTVLGVPAAKFNDDRLERMLDAIAEHGRDIWLDIVDQALLYFDIDLRFLFPGLTASLSWLTGQGTGYDLTAFVMQGEFEKSDLASYGFAHLSADRQATHLRASKRSSWAPRRQTMVTSPSSMQRSLAKRRTWLPSRRTWNASAGSWSATAVRSARC